MAYQLNIVVRPGALERLHYQVCRHCGLFGDRLSNPLSRQAKQIQQNDYNVQGRENETYTTPEFSSSVLRASMNIPTAPHTFPTSPSVFMVAYSTELPRFGRAIVSQDRSRLSHAFFFFFRPRAARCLRCNSFSWRMASSSTTRSIRFVSPRLGSSGMSRWKPVWSSNAGPDDRRARAIPGFTQCLREPS